MAAIASSTTPIPTTLTVPAAPVSTSQRITTIALKTLAVLGMVIGIGGAFYGATAVTIFALDSEILFTLIIAGLEIGASMLNASFSLLENPYTAVFGAVLLPMVGIALAIPFIIPAAVGAIPGIAVASVSRWGWNQL